MSDSGYIKLVRSQIADKKAQLEGLEEELEKDDMGDGYKNSRIQEIRRLKAEIQNLEAQL